jgi:hypothetical protein
MGFDACFVGQSKIHFNSSFQKKLSRMLWCLNFCFRKPGVHVAPIKLFRDFLVKQTTPFPGIQSRGAI